SLDRHRPTATSVALPETWEPFMRQTPNALPFSLLPLLAGCATITGGARDQEIEITSNPPGAAVVVDGQPRGTTPARMQLSRKTEHQVELSYPGYETAHLSLQRQLNPWVFGNLLCGGLIGITVDVCTDATHSLTPGELAVNLRRTGEPNNYAGAVP